jgi:hypothetical protein
LEFANTSNIPFFKRGGGEQFQPKKKKKPFENLFSRSLIFNGARNTHQNKRTRPLLTLQDHKLRSTFETNFSSSLHEHKAINISTINKFYRLVNWEVS